MRKLWIGGVVVALVLLVYSRYPVGFSATQQKDETKPAGAGPKGGAAVAFLPVAIPSNQGGRDVYVVPEEVIAIHANNAQNTSTTIIFRQNERLQVNASDTTVLKALQSGKYVRPDGK